MPIIADGAMNIGEGALAGIDFLGNFLFIALGFIMGQMMNNHGEIRRYDGQSVEGASNARIHGVTMSVFWMRGDHWTPPRERIWPKGHRELQCSPRKQG